MCKKILIAIIFLVIFGSFGIGNTNQFKILRHKNFLIKYKISSEKFALKIVSLIEENLNNMVKFYKIKPDFSVNIIIVESADEFKFYSQSHLPDWTGAAYLITQDLILLKTPTIKNIDFKRDFLHELSHLFFHKKFPDKNIPLWYNEGLAEYLSGKSINLHSGLVLSNAIWAKTIIPFKEIDSLLLFSHQKAELAYAQSLSAILFIKEKLNDQRRWYNFQEMISENGWTSTFTKSLNMDEIDFEVSWYRHIEDKYRWLFILNVENLVWVILFIVLALGMYLIRNRNRKLLKKWEDEEQMYGYENYNTSEFESDYSNFYKREE